MSQWFAGIMMTAVGGAEAHSSRCEKSDYVLPELASLGMADKQW
jgi:hypothetical protein